MGKVVAAPVAKAAAGRVLVAASRAPGREGGAALVAECGAGGVFVAALRTGHGPSLESQVLPQLNDSRENYG